MVPINQNNMAQHDDVLEKLIHSKSFLNEVLGIEKVVWGASELIYWKQNMVYCEIDVCLMTGDKYERPYHVIEYKSTDSYRERALEQLDRASEFVLIVLGGQSYKHYLYRENGKYVHENIGSSPKLK